MEAAFTPKRLGFGGKNRLKKIAYQPVCLPEGPIYQCGRDPKRPKTMKEKATRKKLSRHYDLCDHIMVYTTTPITALDTKKP